MRKLFERRMVWHCNLQETDVEEIDDPYIDPVEGQLSALLKNLQELQLNVDDLERSAADDENDVRGARQRRLEQLRLVAPSSGHVSFSPSYDVLQENDDEGVDILRCVRLPDSHFLS